MNIFLADDHEIVRRGIKQLLADAFPGVAFGEAGSSAEVMAGLREGAWLRLESGTLRLEGRGARLFRRGAEPEELAAGAELSALLEPQLAV